MNTLAEVADECRRADAGSPVLSAIHEATKSEPRLPPIARPNTDCEKRRIAALLMTAAHLRKSAELCEAAAWRVYAEAGDPMAPSLMRSCHLAAEREEKQKQHHHGLLSRLAGNAPRAVTGD